MIHHSKNRGVIGGQVVEVKTKLMKTRTPKDRLNYWEGWHAAIVYLESLDRTSIGQALIIMKSIETLGNEVETKVNELMNQAHWNKYLVKHLKKMLELESDIDIEDFVKGLKEDYES